MLVRFKIFKVTIVYQVPVLALRFQIFFKKKDTKSTHKAFPYQMVWQCVNSIISCQYQQIPRKKLLNTQCENLYRTEFEYIIVFKSADPGNWVYVLFRGSWRRGTTNTSHRKYSKFFRASESVQILDQIPCEDCQVDYDVLD